MTVTADVCAADPTAAVDPVAVYCPPSNTNSVGAKAASQGTGGKILGAAAGLAVASAAAFLL